MYFYKLYLSIDDNRYITMIRQILFSLILTLALSAPAGDKMTSVPGYGPEYNTSVYSGYLDVKNPNRSLHYIYVESINGANNQDPLTLWLNGGPGCSSLLGFLQQIGPYKLDDGVHYKVGDNLTKNEYSWHKKSNLLFLESPAGVGYSVNNQTDYSHNDATTAYDSLYALVDFFKKYPQLQDKKFFIAGQSYAGKYIPDLAVLIDTYNYIGEGTKINLKAILIGNGVIDHRTIQYKSYEYMIDRRFVDPEIIPIYKSSCQTDPLSAGCRFFEIEFSKGTEQLNPYNVYGYCYYNDSFDASATSERKRYLTQESILLQMKKMFAKNKQFNGQFDTAKFNGAPCAFFDGVHDYFNLNEIQFKAKPGMHWNGPCAQIRYTADPEGSLHSYRHLLGLMNTDRKIPIILYSGTWDSVVPYGDTLKGIKELGLSPVYTYNPWFTNKQHSGFEQIFGGVIFITVKGASHTVPQTKAAEAYNIFDTVVEGHKDGSIYEKGLFWRQRQ